MVAAGLFRDNRVHFQSRAVVDDGAGNEVAGPFETQFTVSASFAPLRGGEEVMAARLGGQQPYIVTVRQSSQTRQATTDWRLVDARDVSRIFNIRAINDPDGRRAVFEILAQQGVAT